MTTIRLSTEERIRNNPNIPIIKKRNINIGYYYYVANDDNFIYFKGNCHWDAFMFGETLMYNNMNGYYRGNFGFDIRIDEDWVEEWF